MSVYETIGIAWVILATVSFTIAFFYLAIQGIRSITIQVPHRLVDHIVEEIVRADRTVR